MKEFLFLLEKKSPPPEIQILSGFEEKKANILQVLQDRTRLELIMKSSSKYVTASSLLLKVIKKDEDYYMMIDSLVPALSEDALLESKIALVSYKIDNIACAFLATLVLYQKSNRTFILSFPARIYRLQRRMYYRVSITMRSMITVSSEHLKEGEKLPAYDISEGGISFLANPEHDFKPGEEYPLSAIMYNGVVLQSRVQVRNIIETANNRYFRQRICCEFVNINARTREIIAKYVFMRQMEEIQKKKSE